MKISVITATWNRAAYLPDALASLSAQTHSDIEHIIQDGGSTDGTRVILEAYQKPGVSIVSEPDDGLYDAINRGIVRATGDVVGLLHSDDMFADADVISDVDAALEGDALDGVYGDLDYVAELNTQRVIRRWRSGKFSKERLRRGWMPPHPTLFLRRSVFERFGMYDVRFRVSADYEAMLRYLFCNDIRLGYIPRVLVKMRAGGASNRSLAGMWRKSREDLHALRRHRVGSYGTLFLKNTSKIGQFF